MDTNLTLYDGRGKLSYSHDGTYYKLVAWVDPGIIEFYRSLVPRTVVLNGTRYPPHISVVRREKRIPKGAAWGKYEGDFVQFKYSPDIKSGSVYWWLNVLSPALEGIRLELGLPRTTSYTRPPDESDYFHMTIGNTKELKYVGYP